MALRISSGLFQDIWVRIEICPGGMKNAVVWRADSGFADHECHKRFLEVLDFELLNFRKINVGKYRMEMRSLGVFLVQSEQIKIVFFRGRGWIGCVVQASLQLTVYPGLALHTWQSLCLDF